MANTSLDRTEGRERTEGPTDGAISVLVFRDADGRYYAVPLDVLTQHRLSAEQRAALEQSSGEETGGYLFDPHSASPNPGSGQYQRPWGLIGPYTWSPLAQSWQHPGSDR